MSVCEENNKRIGTASGFCEKRPDLSAIARDCETAMRELLALADMKAGQILVVGCSSSEVTGGLIGHASSTEVASVLVDTMTPLLAEKGIYLAAQCCEHLNRALIIERKAAERYGYEPVAVVPYPKAGGSFASDVYRKMRDPVAVEHIRAHAGLDIGGTLIGMHLKEVAVPVRLSISHIGEAPILAARTRPKYIGGERAKYTIE